VTVSARSRVGAVLGWPVEHSRSPVMHNAAFAACGIDAVFVALAVPPQRAVEAIKGIAAAGFLGASVTVPLKEVAAAACDRLDPSAERTGAVNCLVFASGEVIGHNTDAGGYVDALREAGVTATRAVVLGAGGAARAVHAGLIDAGASVTVIARRPAAAAWTAARPWERAALVDAFSTADLVVDCTSSALDPAAETDLVAGLPLDALPANATVSALVYHRRPALLDRATARGLRTLDGAGMLVHQGARAFTLWLGVPAPVDAMRAALRDH